MKEFSLLLRQAGLTVDEAAARTGFPTQTVIRWDRGETKPRRAAVEYLHNIARERESRPAQFTFIDLFAGIGGFRRGFESIGGHCVFTSEWNRFCWETYRANHRSDHEIAGDITQLPVTEIPEHDVLLAGFPCQPFSIAGVSKKNALNRPHGFRCEAQGTLFFDVARIIEHHRPWAFLLENVKNLINHDRGRTFEVICRTLAEELGYHIDWRVIDARSWVPQHRERIFIAGFREPTGFSFGALEIPDPDKGPRLGSILHPEDGTERPDPNYTRPPYGRVLTKYTLSRHLWDYLKEYARKHRLRGNGFGYGLNGPDDVARTMSARYYKDGAEILIRQHKKRPRRLTPRECARLMGFETPGGEPFQIPVSDGQAYRQFGNAVAVPVVETVARHMQPHIAGRTGERQKQVA